MNQKLWINDSTELWWTYYSDGEWAEERILNVQSVGLEWRDAPPCDGEMTVESQMPSRLAYFRPGDGLEVWHCCDGTLLRLERCSVEDKWTSPLVTGKSEEVEAVQMYLRVKGTLEIGSEEE